MDSDLKTILYKKAIYYFSLLSGNLTSYPKLYTFHQLISFTQVFFLSFNLLLTHYTPNTNLFQEATSFVRFINNPIAFFSQDYASILWVTCAYIIFTIFLPIVLFVKTMLDPLLEDSLPLNPAIGNFLAFHTEIILYWTNNYILSETEHRNLRALLITLAVLNSLMGLMRIALAYSKIECRELLYRKAGQHQGYVHLVKSIVPFVVTENSGDNVISSVIFLVCGISIVFQLIKKLPERENHIIKIQTLFTSMALYMSVTSIVTNFFEKNELVQSIIEHAIFVAPIVGRMSLIMVNTTLERILKEPRKLENPYHICHLLIMIKKIKKELAWNDQQNSFSSSLLNSLRTFENTFVAESTTKKLDVTYYKSQSRALIKEIFDINWKKNEDFGAFMAAYCKLIGLNFKMNLKANNLIKEVDHHFKYDIPTLISTLVVTSKMNDKRRDSALDTNVMIQIEKNFNSIKKLIESFLIESAVFWDTVEQSELCAIRVAKSSKILATLMMKIDQSWAESRNIYIKNHYALPFLIYGVFARNFKNDIKLSTECIRKYQTLVIQDLIFNSVDQENQAIFTVGANNKNLGHILSHSNSAYKLFGLKNAILGHNISKIMPDYFARRHDKYLKNHIENGKTSILNRKVKIYAKDSHNFIFPIYLEVKVEFNQDLGIIFKGIITKIVNTKEAIIVNEKGLIEDYTCKIQEALCLERQMYLPQLFDLRLRNNKSNLQDESSNYKQDQHFSGLLLKLAIPKEDPDSSPDSFSNYRLLNFKPNIKKKIHNDSTDLFQNPIMQQYFVSYFEYQFENETLYALILEDANTHNDFFDEEVSSYHLDVPEEKSEPKVSKKVSNEVIKAMLKKRNLEELPSSLNQNDKTPDDPKTIAYNRSLGSSGSISSNSMIKIEEIQRALLCLPDDTFQSALKGAVSFFLIANIFLAIFMFFFSENILSKVLSALDSVNYSYQRMDSLVWVWRFAIGYQIRVKGISSPTPIDLARQRQVMMMYAPKLKAANNALLNQIWQSPSYIQDQAFAKTVRMNISDEYGNVETTYYNTFEATYAYLDMIVRFNQTPDSVTIVPDQTFVKYLLDNGQNDLLIETEKVIGMFKSEVARIFSEESNHLNTIYGVSTALYIISIVIVIVILVLFYKKTRKLLRAFTFLNLSVVQNMKDEVKHFKEALAINDTKKMNELGDKNILLKTQPPDDKKNNGIKPRIFSEKKKRILMKKYFQHKIPRFVFLIIFNLITITLSSLCYELYIGAISTYFENNNYLTTASYNRYLYTFIIASNYYALADQYTGYIRNVPTIQAIPELIQLISSNDLSLKVYTDTTGFKTPFLKEVFETNLCPHLLYFSFPGKSMNTECATLTKNYTYALVGVNLLVYQESRAISQILIEDHSFANCKKLYSRFNNNVGPGTYVLGAAYEVIYNSMKENFDNLRPEIDTNLLKNFIAQVLISSFLMMVFIKLIYNAENERIYGETLSLIPVAELVSNHMVKSIAIEIYGRRLEPLRGVKIKELEKT